MIIRIVQMCFHEHHIDEFTKLFEERKQKIRSFEGCNHLELWQDANDKRVFFTYSIWDTHHHLDRYRFSDFFKETWGKTKALFAAPPSAWSVIKRSEVKP
jgi:heme-degrading monooxygenase HmoA